MEEGAGHSLAQTMSIDLHASQEQVWNFVTQEDNWTAIGGGENFGLTLMNKSKRVETGTKFVQKEMVGSSFSVVHGTFIYTERPKVAVWRGYATYKLFDIITITLQEGGTYSIEKTKTGSTFSHTIYVDFPDTIFGKLLRWYMCDIMRLDIALKNHNILEMETLKEKLNEK